MHDIPADWKELLKGAGVKKSQLKNRETCMMIISTVAEALVRTSLSNVWLIPPAYSLFLFNWPIRSTFAKYFLVVALLLHNL
jgi:hypothetical protein